MNKLYICGASGHGKVVWDIARLNGYTDIEFLDKNSDIKEIMGCKVAGDETIAYSHPDADFFVAIGNAAIRRRITEDFISHGLNVITLIHPNAVIAEGVEIGLGTAVMAGAIINPDTRVGKGCIINTASSLDHDNAIGDYCHISIGAHLAGTVTIGDSTWVGAGATVSNNINICSDVMIGAGAVVVNDITEAGTYIGLPAKRKSN
ncbi:MAG: acetyltransferase [Pseudobutyrivibrio sp.]|nr:acetyltransferase [Pseudobutyrivibrio sp.]